METSTPRDLSCAGRVACLRLHQTTALRFELDDILCTMSGENHLVGATENIGVKGVCQ